MMGGVNSSGIKGDADYSEWEDVGLGEFDDYKEWKRIGFGSYKDYLYCKDNNLAPLYSHLYNSWESYYNDILFSQYLEWIVICNRFNVKASINYYKEWISQHESNYFVMASDNNDIDNYLLFVNWKELCKKSKYSNRWSFEEYKQLLSSKNSFVSVFQRKFVKLKPSQKIGDLGPAIFFVDDYLAGDSSVVKKMPANTPGMFGRKMILDVKENKEEAISHYSDKIREFLVNSFPNGINICVMPSHKIGVIEDGKGVKKVIENCKLPANNYPIIDSVLLRVGRDDDLSHGE